VTVALWFRLSVYFLVFSSHLSLILTPEIAYGHAAFLVVLLIFALFYERAGVQAPRFFFNAVPVLVLLFCLAYGLFWAEYFFKAGIYFLAYVLAVRMFSLESNRDIWLVYLLSFLELCAASILTIHINFLLGLFLYLVLAGFSLMLFNLKREMESLSTRDRPETVRGLRPSFLALSGGTAMLVFIMAIFLFFFLPRLGQGFFSWRTRMAPPVVGFSDSVRLGEVGPMRMNQAVVMRVRIRGEDSTRLEPLRFRGMALDYYDASTWSDTRGLKILKYYRWGSAVAVKKNPVFQDQETAEIHLEPIMSTVLFAPEGVEAFSLPGKFRAIEMYFNDYYGLPVQGGLYDRIQYQAYFRTPATDPERLHRAYEGIDREKFSKEMYDYLIYPLELEPVCDLARAEVDPDADPYHQTLAILDFLESNYVYTVSPPASTSDNALGEFLFETKQGFCEHFATAAAIMLRCLDVPSRLVTGFSEGTWNYFEHYYLVRQSDAHAWVEVYFPGSGWIPFDPSPLDDRKELLDFRSRINQLFDSILFRWNRWIVDFSILDQVHGFRLIQSRGFRLGREFIILTDTLRFRILRILYQPGALPAIAILIVFVILVWVFLRKPRAVLKDIDRSFSPGPEQKQVIQNYLKMLLLLKNFGFVRRDAQTAREFAYEVLQKAGPSLEPVARMTEIYEQVRFGLYPFPPRLVREFKQELLRCRSALRARR
jgi:transglutaminase-like putative cysteine protease